MENSKNRPSSEELSMGGRTEKKKIFQDEKP